MSIGIKTAIRCDPTNVLSSLGIKPKFTEVVLLEQTAADELPRRSEGYDRQDEMTLLRPGATWGGKPDSCLRLVGLYGHFDYCMTDVILQDPNGRCNVRVPFAAFAPQTVDNDNQIPFTVAYLDLYDATQISFHRPGAKLSWIAAVLFSIAIASEKPPMLLATLSDREKNNRWLEIYTCQPFAQSCCDYYETVERKTGEYRKEFRIQLKRGEVKQMGSIKTKGEVKMAEVELDIKWQRVRRTSQLRYDLEPLFRPNDTRRLADQVPHLPT